MKKQNKRIPQVSIYVKKFWVLPKTIADTNIDTTKNIYLVQLPLKEVKAYPQKTIMFSQEH